MKQVLRDKVKQVFRDKVKQVLKDLCKDCLETTRRQLVDFLPKGKYHGVQDEEETIAALQAYQLDWGTGIWRP